MNLHKVVTALIFITLVIVVVSYFWRLDIFLSLLLVSIAIAKQKVSPLKRAIAWFVVVGFLGSTAEGLMIWLGNGPWMYTTPLLFNIPVWLFPLYGLSGLIFVTLYQGLTNQKS